MSKPFWKYPELGRVSEFAFTWAETALAQKGLAEGKMLSRTWHSGTLRHEVTVSAFLEELKRSGDMTVAFHCYPMYGRAEEWILINNDVAVDVDYTHKSHEIVVNIYGLDVAVVELLRAACQNAITRKVTKGQVYVVVAGDKGPYLHEIGTAGEDFIPSNYRPEVVEAYQHVIDDMNSKDPCGRIVILDGVPGTGKTHMVRAFLNAVKDATFVLVPSNMMSGLGSPNFVKALLEEQRQGHPMVLVVEDADECLTSRKADNLSEISALLNFSDGIFGAVLDIRIVATTNVEAVDLDPAVMRPGRLCRRIEVGRLDPEQARAVYERLKLQREPDQDVTKLFPSGPGSFYTLGEVYLAARGAEGSYVPSKPKARLGFAPSEEESPDEVDLVVAELALKPGDVITTDEGDFVRVRGDGQLEMMEDDEVLGEGFRDFLEEMGDVTDIEEISEDDDEEIVKDLRELVKTLDKINRGDSE